MNDSSGKKKRQPPAEEPGAPDQGGLFGAVFQMFSGMLPGGPPTPSQAAQKGAAARGGLRGQAVLTPQQAQVMISKLFKLVVEVANGMWRIRRRMQSDFGDGEDRVRGLSRHVESTWAAFANQGVEIRDHTGEKYVAGMAMSVVAYQSTAGITYEKVLETVRPSIYFQDQLIQNGEVIVAIPESMPEMDEPVAKQEPKSAAKPIPTEEPAAAAPQDQAPAAEASAPPANPVDPQPPSDEPPASEK